MLIPAAVLVTGLFAVIFATERYGLRFGGVVVVPLLAMYVLFDYRALPLFLVSAATAYVTLLAIERRVVLYGRRMFVAALVVGALVPVTTFLIARFVFGAGIPLGDIAYLGSILPGIAAYNLHRLDPAERVADIVGSLALVIGLVALATFFLVPQLLVTGDLTIASLLGTVQQMLLAEVGPVLTAPAAVLPRWAIVGLFVIGLGVSELARKRYGVRLAGVIAVPLVAVFALQDIVLLGIYLGAIVVAAGFIRVVHRTTFLYGRNLLGGACIMGVVLAMGAVPFLPGEAYGLRPIMVGLLGGITAYNGHVLAPGERIRSVVLSAAAFVVLFAIADGIAILVGSSYVYPIGVTDVVAGGSLLIVSAFVLYEFEALRPDTPIEALNADFSSVIPDGGEPDEHVLSDGGAIDPLAGRTVERVGSNARVVSREEEP